MKKFTNFITVLLTTILCVVGTNNAWGTTYTYSVIPLSVSVSEVAEVTQTTYTLTISQYGHTGTNRWPTNMTLVLISKDGTLEGDYTTSSTTDKIDKTNTSLAYGSNIRALNNTASSFTINKVSEGRYSIGTSKTLYMKQTDPSTAHTYVYNYCYRYISEADRTYEAHVYEFDYEPDCQAPTAISEDELNPESATLSWTSDASAWQYVCLPSATTLTNALWTSNVADLNTNEVTLTGLTPNTKYKFYIRSNCGVSSKSSVISHEFTTPCGIISSLPWNENFNACTTGELPTCWKEKNSGDASVKITTYNYHSSSKSLRLTGGTSSKRAIAILPEFEADIKDLSLSFWYRADITTEYDNYGTPELGYITNPNNAGTFQKVQDLPQASWTKIEDFTVPDNTPDGAYFAIRYTRNTTGTTGYTDIDDITVTAKPACSKPTEMSVVADSETAEGATITWNANGMSNWKLQVSEGDAASWGSDIHVATNSKVLLTGLNAHT